MNTNLSTKEIESLLSLCWMASMADGQRSEPERAEIRRLTETVTSDEIRHDLLYTDVVAGLTTLDDIVAALPDPRLRVNAYEMAACVCISDNELARKERLFLDGLRSALGLDIAVTEAVERNLKILVAAAPAAPAPAPILSAIPSAPPGQQSPGFSQIPANVPRPAPVFVPIPIPAVGGANPGFRPIPVPIAPAAPQITAADLENVIRKGATLAGALEGKGDPMCAIGIVPLQRRVIARIGQMLGKEPDRAKTQEIMNTLGVAQTTSTPAVEATGGYLGKLFGGLMKKAPTAPEVEKNAFAQTYALGQFAKRYFAAGQGWSAAEMKQIFDNLVTEAKPVQASAIGEIQRSIAGVDSNRVGDLVAAV